MYISFAQAVDDRVTYYCILLEQIVVRVLSRAEVPRMKGSDINATQGPKIEQE